MDECNDLVELAEGVNEILNVILIEAGRDVDDIEYIALITDPDSTDELDALVDYIEDETRFPVYVFPSDDVEYGDIVPGLKFDDDDAVVVSL